MVEPKRYGNSLQNCTVAGSNPVSHAIKGDFVQLAGTGPRRLHNEGDWAANYQKIYDYLMSLGTQGINVYAHVGAAQGFDYMFAYACLRHEIPYTLYIPNRRYADYYWKGKGSVSKDGGYVHYLMMVEHADNIVIVNEDLYKTTDLYIDGLHVNLVRNKIMIDRADRLVAWPSDKGGTAHAIRYAQRRRIRVDFLCE